MAEMSTRGFGFLVVPLIHPHLPNIDDDDDDYDDDDDDDDDDDKDDDEDDFEDETVVA